MGTWIKETKNGIYLMEAGFYLEKILKTPQDAKGESRATIIAMKDWFSRTDAPGTLVVATNGAEPEPEPKPLAVLSPTGSGSGSTVKPRVTFTPAHSSNQRARRSGFAIRQIVIHNTVGSTESAIATFKDPVAQVSAHYIIDRSGEIIQMVDDQNCAFHAGDRDMNDESIGIEHEATDGLRGITPEQEKASVSLIKFLIDAYDIPLANITAHRCVVATECPSLIFPLLTGEAKNAMGQNFQQWKARHFT